MRFLSLSFIAFATLLSGCNVQTGIAPLETVISKSADRDFGFTGTWIPVDNLDLGERVDIESYEMKIVRDDFYTAALADPAKKDGENLTVEFRTHEMSKDQPHAIIELEYKRNKAIVYRRLAIAAVKDDHLFLWMIDGKKIGEQLFNDNIAAVIEHFTFHSTVRCAPKKLLDSLSNSSSEIVGPAQVFKRKPKIGK